MPAACEISAPIYELAFVYVADHEVEASDDAGPVANHVQSASGGRGDAMAAANSILSPGYQSPPHTRSNTTAMPWPTPMHMVQSA